MGDYTKTENFGILCDERTGIKPLTEQALIDYLNQKNMGGWEKAWVTTDDGKCIRLLISYGDEEDEDELTGVLIKRRKGDNGNFRIISTW